MRLEKIKKLARGFTGRNKNVNRVMRLKVDHALQHQYRARKEKKREMRALWVQQINAASREHGVKYAGFVNGLSLAEVQLNRKVLASLAAEEPFSFRAVLEVLLSKTPSLRIANEKQKESKIKPPPGS